MSDAVRPPSSHSTQSQQRYGGLPPISTLTNGLPPSSHPMSSEDMSAADSTRDSGTWPQPQSKHNSANSGLQVHTLLNHDDSPRNHAVPITPLSARLSNQSHLPVINQGLHDPGNRDSGASFDSRRSSVDSRMNQGFGNLYINRDPNSPYESANNSQVSLAASLRRPLGAPMSPLSGRASVRRQAPPRVAPPIMPMGRAPGQPDPTAAKPTQGYAWAFPDTATVDERRDSESGDSDDGMSRRNSQAASSIRSSIFSTESRTAGQRPFDDEHGTTHHHSMQHRTIQGLQSDNLSQHSLGNYSRTPELRVSHKLAERKRRSEMKDLFEELNKSVPQGAGAKASKWEILTKAIEYIRSIQHQERQLQVEVQRLQHDATYAREAHKENEMLKTEVQVMHQTLRRLDPNAPHVYGHYTSQLNQTQPHTNGSSGMSLPPLNNNHSSSSAGTMQGVEYGYGQGR